MPTFNVSAGVTYPASSILAMLNSNFKCMLSNAHTIRSRFTLLVVLFCIGNHLCWGQELLTSGSATFRGSGNKERGLLKGKVQLDYNNDTVRKGLFVVDTLNKKTPKSFASRLQPRAIRSSSLRGRVTKVSGDTLFFKLFPIKPNSAFNGDGVVNEKDNKKTFIYIVPGTQRKLPIPYHNWALATTTVPLRVGINQRGETQSDFLNANVALFRVWGSMVLRPNSASKIRNRYVGAGPFLGPTRTTGKVNGEEIGRIGMIYGANSIIGVGGVNFVLAAGGEADASEVTKKFSPWIGFGIGIKLVDLPTVGAKENEQK